AEVADTGCTRRPIPVSEKENPVSGHGDFYGVRKRSLSDTVTSAVSGNALWRTRRLLWCPETAFGGHGDFRGVRQRARMASSPRNTSGTRRQRKKPGPQAGFLYPIHIKTISRDSTSHQISGSTCLRRSLPLRLGAAAGVSSTRSATGRCAIQILFSVRGS